MRHSLPLRILSSSLQVVGMFLGIASMYLLVFGAPVFAVVLIASAGLCVATLVNSRPVLRPAAVWYGASGLLLAVVATRDLIVLGPTSPGYAGGAVVGLVAALAWAAAGLLAFAASTDRSQGST